MLIRAVSVGAALISGFKNSQPRARKGVERMQLEDSAVFHKQMLQGELPSCGHVCPFHWICELSWTRQQIKNGTRHTKRTEKP